MVKRWLVSSDFFTPMPYYLSEAKSRKPLIVDGEVVRFATFEQASAAARQANAESHPGAGR